MLTPQPIIPNRGIVRNRNELYSPRDSFRQLVNMRLVPGGGQLEQTPAFGSSTTWSAGTYWRTDSGASATEASTAVGKLMLSLDGVTFVFGAQSIRRAGVQKQVVTQSAFPAGGSITKQCLVVINDYTALGLTLGLSLDIVIDGATTFKWRKNGGGYTALVPITTTGVSIDGGNATVYFLTATGFTVADTWSYSRYDAVVTDGTNSTLSESWPYAVVGSRIFFIDETSRVMVYENGGVRSVGYNPVYGCCLTVSSNHLLVGGYSTTAIPTVVPDVIGSSDLNNLDNFFATDTNEADTYSLLTGYIPDGVRIATGVFGLMVIRDVVYAFTSTYIWYSNYSGLPVPYNFKQYLPLSDNDFRPMTILSPTGCYLNTSHGVDFFDGVNLQNVSQDIADFLLPYTAATNPSNIFRWGFYDNTNQELILFSGSSVGALGGVSMLVYQERTKSWYQRAASFTANARAAMVLNARLYLTKALGINVEFGSTTTLVNDSAVGTAIQLPVIETQDIAFGPLVSVQDVQDLYLDAFYETSGSAYAATGITVEVANRVYVGATVTYGTAINWTTAAANGELSYRGSGRIFRFRIKGAATAGKATYNVRFNALIPTVYAKDQKLPIK